MNLTRTPAISEKAEKELVTVRGLRGTKPVKRETRVTEWGKISKNVSFPEEEWNLVLMKWRRDGGDREQTGSWELSPCEHRQPRNWDLRQNGGRWQPKEQPWGPSAVGTGTVRSGSRIISWACGELTEDWGCRSVMERLSNSGGLEDGAAIQNRTKRGGRVDNQ